MNQMRRKDREMDIDFAYSIIDKADFGTLATVNEDGTPYCIPISTARMDNKIYIHSAHKGTKIENIKSNPNISISFVGDVNVPPPANQEKIEEIIRNEKSPGRLMADMFTTDYESAVVFGTANIVEDEDEKILGLRLISQKYTPDIMECFNMAIDYSLKATCVIRIDIVDIKGKRKNEKSDEN